MGDDLYRSVGGYVRGNLAISLIAGVSAAAVLLLLGVPVRARARARRRDPRPRAARRRHASAPALVFAVVGRSTPSTAAIVWLVFAIVYQQVENHLIQPRRLRPRRCSCRRSRCSLAVLVGAKLGGVVGALGAIPVASAIQIIVADLIRAAQGGRHTLESRSGAPP